VSPVRSRQPQRTCIACRDTGEKRGLTRIVRSADGHVSLDSAGRKPGRGAYLCEKPQCWERALGRNDGLARALRASVSPDDRAALLAQAPSGSVESETAVHTAVAADR
jgi:predicted RNA-binding protein YlxR (DUF448 family)